MIKERIDQVRLTQAKNLDLSSLDLEQVPSEVWSLHHLTTLNLSHNKIAQLSSSIGDLGELYTLDLRGNLLTSLPSELQKLNRLTSIYLSDNNFSSVPSVLEHIPSLNNVSLRANRIKSIPEWLLSKNIISIEDNPIEDPPIEIYRRGLSAIMNYFEDRRNGSFNIKEAKLIIVGEAGAGKTSLIRRIIDPEFVLDPLSPSTLGIEITPFYFTMDDNADFRMNLWDFGGQEIYHATHQFFLTKRSLYLLVTDNRAEDTDFNYWLQTIKTLSASSPVILFQNEKQSRKRDLNYTALRKEYPELRSLFAFDLMHEEVELRKLSRTIQKEIVALPHVGTELPISWVRIRRTLEELSLRRPYIPLDEYIEICASIGDLSADKAAFLSDYFHDLGVFLHFRDSLLLKKWVILRPEWGTQAVYRVLDDPDISQNQGFFSRTDLLRVWKDDSYKKMHDELLELMMKFELCYQVENSTKYIVPQLLSRSEPMDLPNVNGPIACMKYRYDFMPKGIIARLMVRMNSYIQDRTLFWRDGFVMRRDDSVAVVKEKYAAKEIRIEISGTSRREIVGIIDDHISRINLSYSGLVVKRLLECVCSHCAKQELKAEYDYSVLRKFLEADVRETRCPFSVELVAINRIIEHNFGSFAALKTVKVILSYAKNDRKVVGLIKKHIRTYKKSMNLEIVDYFEIVKGEDTTAERNNELNIAQIYVPFLSVDFFSDPRMGEYELRTALDRSSEGQLRIVPIDIGPCMVEQTVLGSISRISVDDIPVGLSSNVDLAAYKAAAKLKVSIEDFVSELNEKRRAQLDKENE